MNRKTLNINWIKIKPRYEHWIRKGDSIKVILDNGEIYSGFVGAKHRYNYTKDLNYSSIWLRIGKCKNILLENKKQYNNNTIMGGERLRITKKQVFFIEKVLVEKYHNL